MKPLILILLGAVFAAAQSPTIADIARERRALQAQGRSSKVFTTADISPTATAPAADASPAATPDPAATEGAPAAQSTPEAPAVDPLQAWLSETEKLRERIRDLMDQEAKAQLDINSVTNRVFAPDTNETARTQAQTELASAQQKLVGVRDLLSKSRSELQARELQGPPKK
jgi:hypothetical protein